jgi:hypothetical protein
MKKIMMRIVRNFYKDPDAMRQMALDSKYCLISAGNFIGRDTLDMNIMTPELERNIKKLFPGDNFKVIRSRFRSAVEGDTHMTFVHSDASGVKQGWHILIYLTKDPAVKDGLVLYEHVEHGRICNDYKLDYMKTDTVRFDKFKPWKVQPYEYNTAVILDYAYFHAPMHHTGFGDCLENSRLLHIIEIVDTNSSTYKDRIAFESVGKPLDKHPV